MAKKMRIWMRKPVLCLLFVTVVAPIILYTEKLGNFSPSSTHDELTGEQVLTFAFTGGATQQLNVLPQETATLVKEPIAVVYSDNDNARSVESEHKKRVLSTTSRITGSDTAEIENPIRQVTNGNEIVGAHDLQMDGNRNMGDHADTNSKEHNSALSLPDTRFASDNMVRYLKDQLIRAKVYLSLPATRSNAPFIRELRQRIKEVQRALGDSTKDSQLPKNVHEKLKAMDQTLVKGKQIQEDCATVVKKLRAFLHSTEDQLRVYRKQAMFLTQLTAKTLPKGLHCLPLRLSTEFYSLSDSQQQFPNQEKLDDPQLYHYALFSDNILAAAVVVNSTISNAKDPSRHVIHIVTDRLNYAAMRMWFLLNPPGKATINIQNVEEFTWLNSSYSPVLKQLGSPSMREYYFKRHRASDSNLKFRNPKYLSILNHLRFYLPEIFPKLKKILFVDDDIVVQKDLSRLWSVDLKGNVNGAVETCGETFHRFNRYLNFSNPLISKNFDPHACGWAYGMNIFDLEEWKRQNITEIYHTWQKLNHDRQLWKLGTLPPGLITFYRRTYPLDRSWHVLGLGYDPSVNTRDIERASVVHYNGNMKPWLETGMPKYRGYWSKYIDYDQVYLRECNINP